MGGKPILPVSVNFENMTRRTVIKLCAEANVRPGFGRIKFYDLRTSDEVYLTTTCVYRTMADRSGIAFGPLAGAPSAKYHGGGFTGTNRT